ncbi:long-chain fatty acid--CoA ligase [Comamonas sp. CMM03]|uniref:long-chain fatty acid--CoA ligase n=1 Tax=Comamonas sp. CMM03 TaxID=2854781 RepID=UPI001C496E5B|nr:long-chain fatty acid--CoA ligase [Comamonas sp. CMM03]MBV7417368.1 long-chain fatty acid--CoA ligase [Comamonas sp. CMM03]
MRPHHAFWPRRLPHALTVPATSLWDNLEISARRYPDKAGLVFFGRRISYREMADTAERLAAHMHAQGVRKGDRVILLMQNMAQLVIGHFAIQRANAVVVPVNPMNLAEELKHYITDGGVKLAITTADLATELAKASNALAAADRLSHMVVTQLNDYLPEGAACEPMPEAWEAWLKPTRALPALDGGSVSSWKDAVATTAPVPALEVGPDDLSVLPYTSGTTGLPKGCMHTHRSIMHNAMASSVWGGSTSENVTLAVVPMFHITGMVSMMHCNIVLGATMVLLPRWDREVAGRLISQYRVTHWTNIPTMVIDLMGSPNYRSFDLSSLVYIGGGGAAMPQAVAQRLKDEFDLSYQEGYGLTETAAPSHNNPYDHPKQQCLGIPFMGTESFVANPDTLEEMPQGETGEILVHGPQVFQGYWNNPEATRAAFVDIGGKKFFRTGDLGRMDEEGYFFLTDRLKRMINASGFKVWPAEVEALMFSHPAIQEACVIAAKDAYRGETVKAVVVLRQAFKGQVSEEDIVQWCREHMAVYKVPRIVQFADALPKSGSGKVMWRQLQELEAAAAPAAANA